MKPSQVSKSHSPQASFPRSRLTSHRHRFTHGARAPYNSSLHLHHQRPPSHDPSTTIKLAIHSTTKQQVCYPQSEVSRPTPQTPEPYRIRPLSRVTRRNAGSSMAASAHMAGIQRGGVGRCESRWRWVVLALGDCGFAGSISSCYGPATSLHSRDFTTIIILIFEARIL